MKSIYSSSMLSSLFLSGILGLALGGCKLETGGSNSGGIGGTTSCKESEMVYGSGGRIIGGQEVQMASEGSHRTVMIALNLNDDDTIDQMCSGVLLDSKHVLTAAHCFDRVRHLSNPSENLRVFQKAPSGCEGVNPLMNPEALRISAFELHPAYLDLPLQSKIPQNLFSMYYDLAILQLERPVLGVMDELQFYAGDGSDVSRWLSFGFGRKRPTLLTADLSKVALREVDLSHLKVDQSETLGLPIATESEFYFFNQTQGKGVCRGDSGSGVFVEHEGQSYLAGVASFVFDPKNPMSLDSCQTYSAFTQIGPHLDWIQASLKLLRARE